jgi:predicted O-methyltransferase YrrM
MDRELDQKIRKGIRRIGIYLLLHGNIITEGSASPEELAYLAKLCQKRGPRLIGETGFNAGFSSYAFLSANPESKVISFDTGDHRYVKAAKKFIDREFPGRHTLIYGNSRETLPRFKAENPAIRFDLFLIDGGHDYATVKSDILNVKSMCAENAPVIIDDLTPWLRWGKGPTQAWSEALREGAIVQEELFKDGKRVDTISPPGKRSWAMGKYRH